MIMALLKYLCQDLRSIDGSCVPSLVPSETAKQAYSNVSDNLAKGSKRGEYQKFIPEDKAKIGRYASENGVRNAVRKF